jgi:hypothetical protein
MGSDQNLPARLVVHSTKKRRILFGASVVSGLAFLLNLGGVPGDIATWAGWLKWLSGHRSHGVIFVVTAAVWLCVTLWLASGLLRDASSFSHGEGRKADDRQPALPTVSLAEAASLGEQCTDISKEIYAFLNTHATRTDEAKVIAEYREEFDARVHNLCLALITGGLAEVSGLKNVDKPATTLSDIQWIARGLASQGEGYSRSRLAKYQAEAHAETPTRVGAQPTLVRAKSANDDHFPRIESAVDSFGNSAVPTEGREYSLWAQPRRVLRPGQQVSFQVEVSDPNGEDVAMHVLSSGSSLDADVTITREGTIVWNVRDEDIADPAYVHIYASSQRSFHRENTWDASANFIYRVLPRLAAPEPAKTQV